MSFFGSESVVRARDRHLALTGKLLPGTLRVRGSGDTFTDIPWANAYLAPVSEMTGLGTDGPAVQTATGYLFQIGESDRPRVDDVFVDSTGTSWLIKSVVCRLNADSGYSLNDCTFTRMA